MNISIIDYFIISHKCIWLRNIQLIYVWKLFCYPSPDGADGRWEVKLLICASWSLVMIVCLNWILPSLTLWQLMALSGILISLSFSEGCWIISSPPLQLEGFVFLNSCWSKSSARWFIAGWSCLAHETVHGYRVAFVDQHTAREEAAGERPGVQDSKLSIKFVVF